MMQEHKPVRLIVGAQGRTPKARDARRELQLKVLEAAHQEGGWTLPSDRHYSQTDDSEEPETRLQSFSSQLDAAKVSVVTEFQRPAGVPREAADQASYLGTSYTRDIDTVARLAEMLGRSRVQMRGAIRGLGKAPFTWIVVSRSPRDPLIVTKPPKPTRQAPAK